MFDFSISNPIKLVKSDRSDILAQKRYSTGQLINTYDSMVGGPFIEVTQVTFSLILLKQIINLG